MGGACRRCAAWRAQGCRGFGMEPQPELYVTGAIAVLGIVAMDASKKRDVGAPTKKKRK